MANEKEYIFVSTKRYANVCLQVQSIEFISVDENDLETLSHDVKMNYTDYTAQTRKALTRVNLGSLNFVYQTKKQKDGSLLLSWKKHMMAENIKVSPYATEIRLSRILFYIISVQNTHHSQYSPYFCSSSWDR